MSMFKAADALTGHKDLEARVQKLERQVRELQRELRKKQKLPPIREHDEDDDSACCIS